MATPLEHLANLASLTSFAPVTWFESRAVSVTGWISMPGDDDDDMNNVMLDGHTYSVPLDCITNWNKLGLECIPMPQLLVIATLRDQGIDMGHLLSLPDCVKVLTDMCCNSAMETDGMEGHVVEMCKSIMMLCCKQLLRAYYYDHH